MTTEVIRNAIFSPDRKYRYSLSRYWGRVWQGMWADPYITFVCLNPSTANETTDDPTVRRCMGFTEDWGYKGFQVLNLFALVSTVFPLPATASECVGADNDTFLTRASVLSDKVIAGWGNMGASYPERVATVTNILTNCRDVYCLALTKTGNPRHPLYVPKLPESNLVIYSPFRGKRIDNTKEARDANG